MTKAETGCPGTYFEIEGGRLYLVRNKPGETTCHELTLEGTNETVRGHSGVVRLSAAFSAVPVVKRDTSSDGRDEVGKLKRDLSEIITELSGRGIFVNVETGTNSTMGGVKVPYHTIKLTEETK